MKQTLEAYTYREKMDRIGENTNIVSKTAIEYRTLSTVAEKAGMRLGMIISSINAGGRIGAPTCYGESK